MAWWVQTCGNLDFWGLRRLPNESVDAIVTDPPYGLGSEPTPEQLIAYLSGDEVRLNDKDFMGKDWSMPTPAQWRECHRVLKPGAHLLSFGGSRTGDLITLGLRVAGFEIRDQLEWFYGSGFPKSLDLARAIDMALCELPGRHYDKNLPKGDKAQPGDHKCPEHPDRALAAGQGTALKPGHEPIILARKPFRGALVRNVLAHGAGGLNIDACRVGGEPRELRVPDHTEDYPGWGGLGGSKGDGETAEGRWPPNILLTHAEGCRPVGTQRIAGDPRGDCNGSRPGGFADVGAEAGDGEPNGRVYGDELAEVWACVDGCPVGELDRQTIAGAGANSPVTGNEPSPPTDRVYGEWTRSPGAFHSDVGGAARFFPRFAFRYEPKPARAERDAGLESLPVASGGEATDRKDGSTGLDNPRAGAGRKGGSRNIHPTVKGVDLMAWLVRLVTPPSGLVVDPWCGSGSTGCAAVLEGLHFLGFELDPLFAKIARLRIAHWERSDHDAAPLLKHAGVDRKERAEDQLNLFGGAA